MNPYIGHFKTITTHKIHVLKACTKVGIPLRGITHDLSKYSPKEFASSAKFFNGTKSPISIQKERFGYSEAWANHKGRNTHHWEHWTDFQDGKVYCMKMPIKDVKEMLCDWIGAGKAYNKEKWTPRSAYEYYQNHESKILFHGLTRVLVERSLLCLLVEGEEAFYSHVKRLRY